MDEDALVGRIADGIKTDSTPVYLVFDLLWVGGRPIIAQPLLRRREQLARLVRPGPELVVLPGVVREGMDLYFAVTQQGLRGVMARHLRSPYLPGRQSELWRSIATQTGRDSAPRRGRTGGGSPAPPGPGPDPAPAPRVLGPKRSHVGATARPSQVARGRIPLNSAWGMAVHPESAGIPTQRRPGGPKWRFLRAAPGGSPRATFYPGAISS